MKCFCVCSNIPDTIQKMLEELNQTSITYLEANTKVPKKLKTDYLFILSFSDFKHNLSELNGEAYQNKTIIVFSPVIKVKYFMNVSFLDVVKKSGPYTITSEYKNLSLETLEKLIAKPFKTKRKVKEEDKEFKFLLIDGVRAGSLLNPLMTLLYSVKAEGAVKIKEIVLSWLVSKDKIDALSKSLKSAYEWGTVSTKFCTSLIELLTSELGQNYKKAFSKIESMKEAGEKPNAVSIAKKYGIDDYELRYILTNLINTRHHKLDGMNVTQVHKNQKKASAAKKALAAAEAED